ncbi:MAG: hypothetical protein D3910_09350 [Candidatus Electrothrix sp. ATG2]|nr:hypothetical protein [Candidatus Electrothrix sp. ATG2]
MNIHTKFAIIIFFLSGGFLLFPINMVTGQDGGGRLMNISAQVVLKRADGSSILDSTTPPLTSNNIGEFFVEPDRIKKAQIRLKRFGFSVGSHNKVSLSITGSIELFTRVFGIDEDMISSNSSDYIHATVIPYELKNLIADVYVPRPPIFFDF